MQIATLALSLGAIMRLDVAASTSQWPSEVSRCSSFRDVI
jgi:hypothetical protein